MCISTGSHSPDSTASAASLLWFSALGYGARRLAPLFARPRAWQVLDALIGFTMLALAAGLIVAT